MNECKNDFSPISNKKEGGAIDLLEESDGFAKDDEYQVLNLETGKFDPIRPVTRQNPRHERHSSMPDINSNNKNAMPSLFNAPDKAKSPPKLRKMKNNDRKKYAPYMTSSTYRADSYGTIVKRYEQHINNRKVVTSNQNTREPKSSKLKSSPTNVNLVKSPTLTAKSRLHEIMHPTPPDVLLISQKTPSQSKASKKYIGSQK